MRRMLLALLVGLWAGPTLAEGERAGNFDYYVMSLSWSSAWCELEGDARDDPQCDPGRGLTFVLHGLWPQYEDGWPSWCRTVQRDPSRAETAAMADIMGGSGLAFYQWKKHGRCAGLAAPDYFATARQAFGSIAVPPLFSRVSKDLTLPASVIEAAFLEANPGMTRDQVTVTCSDGLIQEVRICLTPDLDPRRCGADVIRDCTLKDAVLEAVR
ncbi:MAG: ribonuclease T2 [Tabrizicola sp.]|uniref:ribonuclease T2 n=1 Tax=Tabrizicola sp. TaxID=2005166 RepID=UPI002733B2A6|nr:ribonuclease T2 [Tabrizicola sp.]MDP3262117.1 ribonuclease T2 [Tabrizicola sp.]MDP3648137.1 ribonuclease T2 [Paracoccaceae bacterium]MDZ4066058.1 ribonuclease T2 [Tabrizicola sp.]